MPLTGGPRLRQVALVASDLDEVTTELQSAFGWPDPYHDPGVGTFGLTNAVFAVGDTFVEVVSPVQPGTTAGRYLQRRGGDSGYMAIFQVADLAAARRRIRELGIRVVWKADHDDIAGTHLHPKDVPGAIVSIDWANPPESWRWAGPDWTAAAPPHPAGGLTSLTIEVNDPVATARLWADAIGLEPLGDPVGGRPAVPSGRCDRSSRTGTSTAEGRATVHLAAAGQVLHFVPVATGRGEGITALEVTAPVEREIEVAGVKVRATRTPGASSAHRATTATAKEPNP